MFRFRSHRKRCISLIQRLGEEGLPEDQVANALEDVSCGEWGLALDMAAEYMSEHEIPVSAGLLRDIEDCFVGMGYAQEEYAYLQLIKRKPESPPMDGHKQG